MPAISFQVSTASGIPIYRQLIDQIRAQIAGGRIASGEFLPSVRQLAEELEVNPMTVSKAYSLLERDGLVELVRGQGMIVKASSNGVGQKTRKQVLLPLLKQVAHTAQQLNLSPQDVLSQLKTLLEENTRD
jgi:GntR family transcriptional regulator